MAGTGKTLTVGQVFDLLKVSLSRVFPSLLVCGEVIDPFLSSNGHLYLRLRDAQSELKVVMWRREVARLRNLPQAGDRIVVRGTLTVYPSRGELQVQALALAKEGQGEKLAELAERKEKLRQEGLFDRAKRDLPEFPRRIGVVTSAGSAVLHDIFESLRLRNPSVELWLSPASVSGREAPAELIRALAALQGFADTIIIARGGGSFEDLLPFSDEQLVRAVAASTKPVIAAIGHGSDSTLLDLVADWSVVTPTAAVEAAVPLRSDLYDFHESVRLRLGRAMNGALGARRHELGRTTQRCQAYNPQERVLRQRDRLDGLKARLEAAMEWTVQLRRERIKGLRQQCLQLGPGSILKRGFALVMSQGGPITSVLGRSQGEDLELQLADGQMLVTVKKVIPSPMIESVS